MITTAIALQRLYQQGLSQNSFASPKQVVASLGAVQAQDYYGAKWALGLRMPNATDDVIEKAFTEGTILRTHVMRPTWHFVTPADIRWMLDLTAPRVKVVMTYMNRTLELNETLLSRCMSVIVEALEGSKQLTRDELGLALAEAGIVTDGQRLGHIVMRAELDAVVCSGPRHGKQFTYMLLDERVPQAKKLPRDEALAELVQRYFTGHGPATVHDFAWWSGLTIADAKAGLEMVGSDLIHEVIDGQIYWFSAAMPPQINSCDEAYLLPLFDEFLVGFAGFDKSRRGDRERSKNGIADPSLMIGSNVVGSWKRTLKKGQVVISLDPFAPLTTAEIALVADAAQRYGDFLGMPTILDNHPALIN